MSHPLGLASRFTAELATIKGPLLERSGFFVSVGNIPSPICHAVEKIISFRLLKKGHMQVELCEIPFAGAPPSTSSG
jgi:hypothetical protein